MTHIPTTGTDSTASTPSTRSVIAGSTSHLARSLAVVVALAGLSLGAFAAIGANAAQADQPTSSRSGGGDGPGDDDHSGHGSGDDDDHDGSSSGSGDSGGRDDDRVIRTGRCSGGADWKLKVKTDDGRLEVEGEVDSNVAGQRWDWTLSHNGSVTDSGVGITTGRSGSFEVERKVVDLAGTDTFVFDAVRDGQVCRGVVNY